MLPFLHLSPILLVLSAILILKQAPVNAALAGATLALILTLGGAATPLSGELARLVTVDTLILFANVGCVLAPGMALVVLIERTGATQALSDWLSQLRLQGGVQRIGFIVLGLAPLLESMTGFGVSLMATIPVLLTLFERDKALRIALAGMAIMPWGTLGLATVMGAALLHLSPMALASQSALTSAPVLIGLALMAAWIGGYRSLQAQCSILMMGALFVAVLYVISLFLGPEIAGVGAGMTIVIAGLVKSQWGQRLPAYPPKAAWPYLLLFFSVILLKALVASLQADTALLIQGAEATWKPLASPGIPLLIVCLVLCIQQPQALGLQTFWKPVYQRARRPLLTILCFLFMSQIMVKAGFLSDVRAAVSTLDPHTLPLLGAMLGGIGGYLTGSNVGGNVLMMPTIAHIPAALLSGMAATVNSAAGHAALGSLPMIAMISGLAKIGRAEEHALTRFALAIVAGNIVLVGLAGVLVSVVR